MSGLCKYKHIFGREREGAHALRVFNVAVVDLVLTVALGWAVAKWTGYNAVLVVLALFFLGIIMHRLFCVNTTVNMLIFGKV